LDLTLSKRFLKLPQPLYLSGIDLPCNYFENVIKQLLKTPITQPIVNSSYGLKVGILPSIFDNMFVSSSKAKTYKFIYESIMVSTEDLKWGGLRLLEVDKPLYLPVDVRIRIIVSSDDVLHSWAVPSLGLKIDCVPGRLNVVEFKIARRGVFYGQCSEICGTQHGFMPICVIAVPKSVFYQFR
jgi:hypothetical protein